MLREAFGYGHAEIAEFLDLSEANSRDCCGARERVGEPRARFEVLPYERRRVVEQFLRAATRGDLTGLEQLFAQDVVAWGDGGGEVTAARHPVVGAAKAGRLIAGTVAKGPADTEVHGEPSLVALVGSTVLAVVGRSSARRGSPDCGMCSVHGSWSSSDASGPGCPDRRCHTAGPPGLAQGDHARSKRADGKDER